MLVGCERMLVSQKASYYYTCNTSLPPFRYPSAFLLDAHKTNYYWPELFKTYVSFVVLTAVRQRSWKMFTYKWNTAPYVRNVNLSHPPSVYDSPRLHNDANKLYKLIRYPWSKCTSDKRWSTCTSIICLTWAIRDGNYKEHGGGVKLQNYILY